MSTTIEQKVVEMRFDNKQFENGVSTTMSTLDKLKQSLNFSGASKGLENIGVAARSFDMSMVSGAVETVQSKFSALEVMAVTALANITNSAVNAGKRVVSALTIDPIKTGFEEYETKINAIQTIMSNTASKGTTMEDVTRVIGELNTYADKTIYNFAEMTRNIGTFTAAGVGLEESAAAIQGIANLAASSGSTSQQASTAMYQLSQALASGTVKLMDWNSVVNAGMGGELFQNALKETAREHGIAVDEIIAANGSFRESLQEGWITADVLNETLKKFTVDGANKYAQSMLESGKYTEEQAQALIKSAQSMEDAATKVKTFTQLWDTLKESAQSGWSQSWEIIVGDFEEAKALFTEVSDVLGGVIGASADARNEMLEGWKELGGRTDLIEAFRNAFQGIVSVITPIKDAFREIFPRATAEDLFAITEGLKNFTAKLQLVGEPAENLKRTFKGLFSIVDIGKTAFLAIFGAVKPLAGGLGDLGAKILETTAGWGDWLTNLAATIKTTDVFGNIIRETTEFVNSIVTAVKNFAYAVREKFDFPGLEVFHTFIGKLHEAMSNIGSAADGMKSSVVVAVEAMSGSLSNNTFIKTLQVLWDGVKAIGQGIAKALGSITEGIVSTLGNVNFDNLLSLVNTASFTGIAVTISKFLKSVSEPFDEFKGALGGVTEILDNVKGCFEAWQSSLKADALLKIASAIGILAASILVIASIDGEKLSTSLVAVSVMFAELMTSMSIFGKVSGNLKGVTQACAAMLSISTSVLVLSTALKTVSELNFGELVTGLVGIVGLTGTMVAAAKVLGSGGKTMVKGAAQMVIFAAAIKVLASACMDLSVLSWSELTKGLVGVGALMAEIAIATNLMGNASHILSTGAALVAIAASIKVFASAVADMSALAWDELGRGLTGMAGALGIVAVAVNLMPKNMLTTGAGLVAVSAALLGISVVLDKMGSMGWDEIARGLTALGGAMTILSVGLIAMNGTLAGSAAMLVAAGALAVLTPVLSILGAMSWESIAKGLASIAGAFTVIGVAGLVLTPIVPAIVALGGAFTLVGAGILGVGAGLLAAGAGLTAITTAFAGLAAVGVAGATAVVSALTVIVTGAASLIPAVATKIGEGIIAICKVVKDGAPAIGEAIKALVLTAVDVLMECTPKIVDGALQLISVLLESLVGYTPRILEAIGDLMIAIVKGIGNSIPKIVKSAGDLAKGMVEGIKETLSAFVDIGRDIISGLIQGIKDKVSEAINAVVNFGSSILNAVKEFFGISSPSKVFMEIGEFLIEGLIGGISSMISKAVAAITNLASKIKTAISNWVSSFYTAGVDMITKMVEGLTSKLESVGNTAKNIGTTIKDAIGGFASDLKTTGVTLGSKLVDGLTSKVEAVKEIATTIASAIKNTIDNWTDSFKTTGTKLINSLVTGFSSTVKSAKDTASNIVSAVKTTISDWGSKFKTAGSDLLTKVVDGFNSKLDSAKTTASSIISSAKTAISNLASNFKAAGSELIESVIAGFNARLETIKTAASNLASATKTALSGWWSEFKSAGSSLIGYVIEGFNTKLSSIKTTASSLISGACSSISAWYADFKTAGSDLILGIMNGFSAKLSSIKTSVSTLVSSAVDAVGDWWLDFYEAGKDLIAGMINGITAKAKALVSAASGVVNDAIQAAKNLLGIHSPSRVFMEFGRYVDEGFIIGLEQFAGKVKNATMGVGQNAVDGMQIITSRISDVLNNDCDLQPTIRPVLDLTNVEAGAGRLNAMFSRTQAMTINSSQNHSTASDNQNGNGSAPAGTVYTFTQNNYSPKSLSRVEIYRQTKNQFSTLERMVST